VRATNEHGHQLHVWKRVSYFTDGITLVADAKKTCPSHRAIADGAVCEPLGIFFYCNDFDAIEDIEPNNFEVEAPSKV
jgi:hypothetical protein